MIKNLHFFFLPFGVEIVVGFVVSVDCDEIAKTEGFQDCIKQHTVLWYHFICRRLNFTLHSVKVCKGVAENLYKEILFIFSPHTVPVGVDIIAFDFCVD